MWHPFGDPSPSRRHIDWKRRRTETRRFDEQRARQGHDNEADACATRFAQSLEDAVLDLETRKDGFEHATRKSDHVEELRRVLGILLDILADWEMLAERMG
ncbi:MAG: hypothetical protein JWR24_4708 [Actinoallomurus sp.]|jgi:hypothetical protein|nr:hypothetical protein [Actinoallomurus sp.]